MKELNNKSSKHNCHLKNRYFTTTLYFQNNTSQSPFGTAMAERSWSDGYRYGFQAQESDEELFEGAITFKYRLEDSRLGRFFSVDPLFPKYVYNSVYAFSENRLLDAIELEGCEAKRLAASDGSVETKDNNAGYTKSDDEWTKYLSSSGKQLDPAKQIATAAFPLENSNAEASLNIGRKIKAPTFKSENKIENQIGSAAQAIIEETTSGAVSLESPVNSPTELKGKIQFSLGNVSTEGSGWSLGVAGQDKSIATKQAIVMERIAQGGMSIVVPQSYTITETIESTNILFFTLEGRKVYINPIGADPKLLYENTRYGFNAGKTLFKLGPVGIGAGITFFTDW